ncbi:MAG: penicillin acylase family protein [Planctomycetes bacterium]|nr:penicillin acylase family protein [Planctomycetota bacterium]
MIRNLSAGAVVVVLLVSVGLVGESWGQGSREVLEMGGVDRPVEIVKDIWGISHIYAESQRDLFYGQGFNVARDRLFQLEMWRRQASGTLAEILGEKALMNDLGARLFKFRGDLREELNHYHPDGEEIVNAFVRGINGYIDLTRSEPELLPIEFRLLGIKPQYWTPEIVISRHNGLYRNVTSELALARRVERLGGDAVEQVSRFQPGDVELELAEGLDVSVIPNNVLDKYRARSRSPRFGREDIVDEAYREQGSLEKLNEWLEDDEDIEQGSNNWVVNGEKTFSRFPIMANDPHRSQQIPSLRYFVHLVAPGWNVIGGGEPVLPGVSIGHNEYGAWGLTIFSIDQEDLYVYDLNPENPGQYMYRGEWEDMKVVVENILVKGGDLTVEELKFTRHGPVVYQDFENLKAYVVRAAWLEVGAAPYLASMRMNQARTWEEFREGCSYSRTPSENMIWADRKGNIGWQAVGITPNRKNWYGLLPVAGDGRYEWEGFVPIKELPHVFNPPEGYFASANEYNVPHGYRYRLGYSWSEPFRVNRIKEVLESGKKFTMADMMRLQLDELSIPARNLVGLVEKVRPRRDIDRQARERLLGWDFVMDVESVEATIYSNWESRLRSNVRALAGRGPWRDQAPQASLSDVIQLLHAPDARFGGDPVAGRDDVLLRSLSEAVDTAVEKLGADMGQWQYGQEGMHYIRMSHLLSRAVNAELRGQLDLGPMPRGGSGSTVNNTGSGNQRSGASFRVIVDTGDWDNSVGTNNPGQSGDPASGHYGDLFKMWAKGEYFPLLYSRGKIDLSAEVTTILKPKE